MDFDRWQELDTLFEQALDLSGAERDSFVRRVEGTDPELANRLRTLLETADGETAFLETPALALEGVAPEDAPRDRAGDEVGPYRILRRLGRGGMASVYLAERADGQWRNRVALKILHRGLDTESIVRRFLEERQILSSLDHPNIARFLGGGTSADGLPYLVMEYVEDGTTLLEHCDREGLGIRERVRLFCDVASAVQAAHQRLIAHRDVKPSNVMVDGKGRVKLLDFGIAKLLAAGEDPGVTRVGQRVLTPAYASPEQAAGQHITAASDVYQLGVLLCELLSGHRPYDVPAAPVGATERAILTADPTPPSRLLTAADAASRDGATEAVRARLKGDLDTIVLRALRKDPEERYASAGALADDLERHLRGLPVSAQPDRLAYRAGKFIRRHRAGVATAAAFVILLAGASVFSTAQAIRADRERDRARLEQLRAERVTAFVTDVLRLVDPDVGGEEARRNQALLDASVERARIQLADQPLALADVLGTIGDLYIQLGRGEPSVRLLREAMALREGGLGTPERAVRDLTRLGDAELHCGDGYEAAMAAYREAVALARAELGPGGPALARALTAMADAVREPGTIYQDQERARELLGEAIDILEGAEPTDEVREALAEALYMAGTIHRGDIRVAVDRLRRSLAIRRELYGRYNTGTAMVLNDLALLLENVDPVATDSLLAEAIGIQAHLYGMSHTRTLTLMTNRAAVLRDRGAYAEAEPIYRELLALRREHYPDHVLGQAYILHGLGWILAEQGRPEEAEVHLREMLEILEAEGDGMESDRYLLGRSTLGRALALQGRHAEAAELIVPSYRWYRENAPTSPTTGILAQRVAELYADWGRPPPVELPDRSSAAEATSSPDG